MCLNITYSIVTNSKLTYSTSFGCIIEVIKDCAKHLISNSEIEVHIAEWFRRANTRFHRGPTNQQ